MSRSPRCEALRLVRSGAEIPPPPDIPPHITRDTPEAKEFLGSLKVNHYAGLAQIIDLIFEHAVEQRSHEPPYGLSKFQPPYNYAGPTGWRKLLSGFKATFFEAIGDIQKTPVYQNTEAYTRIIGRLDSKRYRFLDWQLDGGIGTGVSTTLTLLRNVPKIVTHHDANTTMDELPDIMRHPRSTALLRRMANLSVNQMFAAQSVLAGKEKHRDWLEINQTLRPELFTLQSDAGGNRSLAYVDFDSLRVPAGYSPHYSVPATEHSMLVSEIQGNQPTTIGCPVTLLSGRLGELMNWGIDVIESEKMWEQASLLAEVKPLDY